MNELHKRIDKDNITTEIIRKETSKKLKESFVKDFFQHNIKRMLGKTKQNKLYGLMKSEYSMEQYLSNIHINQLANNNKI